MNFKRPKREKHLSLKLQELEKIVMEKEVTKYKLKDLKTIVCSTNTAIRFQCPYCNSNYVRKISLDNHVKQKHKESWGNLQRMVFGFRKFDLNQLLQEDLGILLAIPDFADFPPL